MADESTTDRDADGTGPFSPGGDLTVPLAERPRPGFPAPDVVPTLGDNLSRRFETVSVLGRGGMGVVVLALDRELQREVAIKLLYDTSPVFAQMLRREAMSLASLEHDNVVRLYEFGQDGGVPFLILEYIRGQTLANRLANGRPAIFESTGILRDVARGILAAHARGIVHADLKPSNIFLEPGGRAKVADFGLSRTLFRKGERPAPTASTDLMDRPVSDAALTAVSSIQGTPGYMAPELAEGGGPSTACDVYALGVVLHEMLTGQRLFTGDTIRAILHRQQAGNLPRPSTVNRAVPSALDDLALACMDPTPSGRPEVPEVLSQLDSWVDRLARARRHAGAAGFPPRPYKFLEHYQAGDEVIFFGREAEVAELVALVEAASVRLVMVFGPCGIGKSSLIRAGLVPELTAHGLPPAVLVSGADPAARIEEALRRRSKAGPQVLVVDQLEELFTHNARGSAPITRFFGLVSDQVEQPGDAPKLVLSFRAEFRSELYPLETRLAHRAQLFAVGPMTERALAEAIAGPSTIEHYGFSYEPGFPERLAHDVRSCADERGDSATSMMQIVCQQLYERSRAEELRSIGASLYEKVLGGARGALQGYVEERLHGPGYGADAGLARQMLRALTMKEKTGERYARARGETELLDFPDRDAAARVLERLIVDRLVVREEVSPGERTIRLASEVICSLVDGWAVDADDVERAARSLALACRQWVEGGRRSEDLLTGARLRFVERHRGAIRSLSPDAVALLQASIRSRRIQHAVIAVVGAVIVGIAALAAFAPGRVHVSSDPPGAEVRAKNGHLLGVTPMDWDTFPGTHQIVLHKPNYDSVPLTVTVAPGGLATYSPVLPYPYGLLAVSTDPPGVRCEVVRTSRPATPGSRDPSSVVTRTPFHLELPSGTYTLRLTAPTCVARELAGIVISKNRQLVERLERLEKDLGWLEVETPLVGSRMLVLDTTGRKEIWSATLPTKEHELPSGRYLLEIHKPDHHLQVLPVTIKRGETCSITANPPPVRTIWSRPAPASTRSFRAAVDLDGDRTPDILAMTDRTVVAYSGKTGAPFLSTKLAGSSSAAAAATTAAVPGASSGGRPDLLTRLDLADLDGDRRPEALVGLQSGRVLAYDLQDGRCRLDREFRAPVQIQELVFADLDGDGGADLVGLLDRRLVAVSGRSDRELWSVPYAAEIGQVTLADIDGDGRPDVYAMARSGAVEALSGKDGRSLWRWAPAGHQVLTNVRVVAGDLDGDGRSDLVTNHDCDVVALSGATGRVMWTRRTDCIDCCVGRFRGPGRLDVLLSDEDRQLVVLDGRTGKTVWTVQGKSGFDQLVVADLDNDGSTDVLAKRREERLEAYRGPDGRQLWTLGATGRFFSRPVVADLDGDGVADVVRQDPAGGLRATSGAPAECSLTFKVSGRVNTPPVVADLDRDGQLDAVVCSSDTPSSKVQAVSGRTGVELWRSLLRARCNPWAVPADLDGDGRTELVETTKDRGIRALDGSTGRVLWANPEASTTEWPLISRSPHASDCDIVCLDHHTKPFHRFRLVALAGRTGTVRWRSPAIDLHDCRPPASWQAPGRLHPDVAVLSAGPIDPSGKERTAPSSAPISVVLLDGDTGRPVRSVPTTIPSSAVPNLACADVDDDGTPDFVVSGAGIVEAFSGRSGAVLWSVRPHDEAVVTGQTGPGDCLGFAQLDDDRALDTIVLTSAGRMQAVSGKTGKTLWKVRLPSPPRSWFNLGSVDADDVPDAVVTTQDGKLTAVSGRTGAFISLDLDAATIQGVVMLIDPAGGPGPYTARGGLFQATRYRASSEARLVTVDSDSTVMLRPLRQLLRERR